VEGEGAVRQVEEIGPVWIVEHDQSTTSRVFALLASADARMATASAVNEGQSLAARGKNRFLTGAAL
jgi:hypothetical protein